MKLTKFILLLLAVVCLFSQNAMCADSEDDDPLASNEEYTEDMLAEKAEEAAELANNNADYFDRETFFKEYDTESPEHPEVKMAKKYFPTRTSTIDKERYKTLLKMYMDGTVHDDDIDEDIREEAHAQIEEFVDKYIATKTDKEDFTVEDLFEDFIGGKFHDWLDEAHPETDSDIEPDL